MSSPRPRPDLSSPTRPDRPPIWVSGHQRPSFDLRAYGAYSVIATRAALGPALSRVAGATGGVESRLLAGAFPINTVRLGRAADYLPTRKGIAATVGGLALVLKDASEIVSPPAPPVETLEAYDALWRARKVPVSGRLRGVNLHEAQSDPDLRALRDELPLRPQRPTRPVLVHDADPALSTVTEPVVLAEPVMPQASPPPAPEPEQATLMAIRNMLVAVEATPELPAPTTASAQAQPIAATPVTAAAKRPRRPLPAWTKPVIRATRHGAAFAIGWGLIVVAMPIGLVKAGIAHLDGRDLRDLVEDE